MMPIGPLMIEHRLIERLIRAMEEEHRRMSEQKKARICFVDGAIDFLAMYTDRCHHGKEEGFLFKELETRVLSPEHRMILEELKSEHAYGRDIVGKLVKARDRHAQEDANAFKDILDCFEKLIELYPRHIEKEDKHFFIPSMNYLTKDEQAEMLRKFWEFDKALIHEKYRKLAEMLPSCRD